MVKIFGLIVALGALMAPAQAALLTYNFTNTAVGVVDPGAPAGSSATDFSGGGSVGANDFTTLALSAARTSTFSFTAGSHPISLTDIVFAAKRNQSGASNAAKYIVYFNVGATSTGASGTELINTTVGTTYNATSGDLGFGLNAGEKIHFTIVSSRNSTGSPTISFDSVVLNGFGVPEPTSMAVFGLLGAGVVVRRIRRKA